MLSLNGSPAHGVTLFLFSVPSLGLSKRRSDRKLSPFGPDWLQKKEKNKVTGRHRRFTLIFISMAMRTQAMAIECENE